MRRFWQIEFPVGDPVGGAAFGERGDPATFAIISAIGTGISAASALGIIGGDKDSPQGQMGLPPGIDPAAQAERDAASEKERQRRVSGSRSATNPTGGLGDSSTPSLASKTLLGA